MVSLLNSFNYRYLKDAKAVYPRKVFRDQMTSISQKGMEQTLGKGNSEQGDDWVL